MTGSSRRQFDIADNQQTRGQTHRGHQQVMATLAHLALALAKGGLVTVSTVRHSTIWPPEWAAQAPQLRTREHLMRCNSANTLTDLHGTPYHLHVKTWSRLISGSDHRLTCIFASVCCSPGPLCVCDRDNWAPHLSLGHLNDAERGVWAQEVVLCLQKSQEKRAVGVGDKKWVRSRVRVVERWFGGREWQRTMIWSSLASHTLRRERKGLVTLTIELSQWQKPDVANQIRTFCRLHLLSWSIITSDFSRCQHLIT